MAEEAYSNGEKWEKKEKWLGQETYPITISY